MKLWSLLAVPLLAVLAFGQAAKCDEQTRFSLNPEKPQVYLEFEQFGKADDWGNARLGEVSARPNIAKGDDVWLRLYNNSCWPISFRTLSMYVSKVADPANPGKSKVLFGEVQDGNAANVVYTAQEQDGKYIPWGGDTFVLSQLGAGHSLVFPVYKEHLQKSRSIFIAFNYAWEEDHWSYNIPPEHHSFFWGYRMEEVHKK